MAESKSQIIDLVATAHRSRHIQDTNLEGNEMKQQLPEKNIGVNKYVKTSAKATWQWTSLFTIHLQMDRIADTSLWILLWRRKYVVQTRIIKYKLPNLGPFGVRWNFV